MTAREDREKEKFTKETVVKYFFDMSKSTYTIMVLGGLAALFGIVETNESGTISGWVKRSHHLLCHFLLLFRKHFRFLLFLP